MYIACWGGNQLQEASKGGQIEPPVAEIFSFMFQQRLSLVKMADCGVFFTTQSPKPPILASQLYGELVASYDCVTKPVRMQYHHCELFATMGDFNDDGVEQRRRVVTYGFLGVL